MKTSWIKTIEAIIAIILGLLAIYGYFRITSKTVEGTVRDSKTNKPLPGVQIILKNNEFITGDDGQYYFEKMIRPGHYPIIAKKDGYKEFSGVVKVEENTVKDILMSKIGKPDEPITPPEVLTPTPIIKPTATPTQIAHITPTPRATPTPIPTVVPTAIPYTPTPTVGSGNEGDFSKCSTIPKGSPFIEAYDGTYVKADGIVMKLSVENRYPGWRTWWENEIKQAKNAESSEVLLHQVMGTFQSIYRFGVEREAQLYWVYIPEKSTIEIGPCWKQIQERGRSTFTTDDGKVGEIKKQMIYILKR